MNCQKTFLARAINPLRKDPPKSCIQDKTIVYDTFKNSLFLFKDTRPEAKEFVNLVLPTLTDTTTKPDDLLKLYNSMDGQWLEFQYDTKILYLCSLKISKL